ncbi:hypothetical protein AB0L04_09115 [Streptomyces glaucescens]|uniref:hypothetical protein n=1 Tax=Streptomyces glaucescens TaxID=1907 RepID=UPI00344CC7D1
MPARHPGVARAAVVGPPDPALPGEEVREAVVPSCTAPDAKGDHRPVKGTRGAPRVPVPRGSTGALPPGRARRCRGGSRWGGTPDGDPARGEAPRR